MSQSIKEKCSDPTQIVKIKKVFPIFATEVIDTGTELLNTERGLLETENKKQSHLHIKKLSDVDPEVYPFDKVSVVTVSSRAISEYEFEYSSQH